jgi:hypothetical protein
LPTPLAASRFVITLPLTCSGSRSEGNRSIARAHGGPRSPRRILGGGRQGRDVTVVDLVQSGIAFLLLCLNLGDVRPQFTPLGVAREWDACSDVRTSV